jgi:hypothetical protein
MELCINIYNEFLDTISKNVFNDLKGLNVSKENIEERLNKFYATLQNEDSFLLFSMAKIKAFSSKTVETHDISISLLGEAHTLKQIFNNQEDSLKNNLWELLFNLYIQLEKVHNPESKRISLLKDALKKMRSGSTSTSNTMNSSILKNVLNADVNATTTNMLDDIINSFSSAVNNKGNPFENIMGITEQITSKYGSMIESGEIEIDKILGGMGSMLGNGLGMNKPEEAPVIIDENFSTSGVEIGKVDEEKGGFSLSKLMPLADMVNKIGSVQSEDDIMALKKNMDNFMEKELKMDMSQYKENMDKLEKQINNMKLDKDNVEE